MKLSSASIFPRRENDSSSRCTTVEECIAEIKRKPLVNLWPTLAVLYDVSKGKIYQMAELGEVDVLKTGRLKKEVSASERRKLGI
jgi:hypothetical protein